MNNVKIWIGKDYEFFHFFLKFSKLDLHIKYKFETNFKQRPTFLANGAQRGTNFLSLTYTGYQYLNRSLLYNIFNYNSK